MLVGTEGTDEGIGWITGRIILRGRERIDIEQPRGIPFKFVTPDGSEGSIMLQLADINKPLASVAHLPDLGYCAVFNRHNGRDVSYLLHKATNQYLKMRRERGVFVIDAYLHELIAPRTDAEKIPSDFNRRG